MSFKRRNNQKRDRRNGYVLLVVLSALVLVITVLSSLAQISLRRSVAAVDAQRDLQMRWGELTLRRAILKRAGGIFDLRYEKHQQESAGTPPPPPFVRTAITFGGATYDVLLGDEDAKLNLNTIFHQSGASGARSAAAELVDGAVSGAIRMLPAADPVPLEKQLSFEESEDDDAEPSVLNAFESWGQVFDIGQLKSISGSGAVLPNVTTGITCWGNGQLNFQRAADAPILALAKTIVQDREAENMLQRYRENPTMTLQTALQLEVSEPQQREMLARLFSESSTNFSVWIHASSRSGLDRMTFSVSYRDDEGVTRYTTFAD